MSKSSEWKMIKAAVGRAEMIDKILAYVEDNEICSNSELGVLREVAVRLHNEASELFDASGNGERELDGNE